MATASDFLINLVTLTDDNGAPLEPGDSITFCVTVQCSGSGTCQNTSVGWVNTQNNTTPSSGTFTAIPTPLNMNSPEITDCASLSINLNTANQQINMNLTGDGRCNGPGGDCNPTANISSEPITPVTLSAISNERIGNKVKVDWSTSSELFNVGFQLWGLDGKDSKWEKLHGWLDRSGIGNAVEPQSYSKTVGIPGSINNLIALGISSVDNDGSEHYYGPFDLGRSYGNLNSLKPIAWDHIRAQTDAQMASRGYIKDRIHGYRKISAGSAADAATGQSVIEFKVQDAGVYRLTSQALLNAGMDWAAIVKRDIALIDHSGKAVVRYIAARGAGSGQLKTLGANGEIYFYAQGVDNVSGLYTDSSVYRLVVDRYRSLNAQYQRKRGIKSGYSKAYQAISVVEIDRQYSLTSAGDDPWLDAVVLSYSDKTGSYGAAIPVEADALWDRESVLTLNLASSSALAPVDSDGDGVQDTEHTVEAVVLSANGPGGLLSVGTNQAVGAGEWTSEFTIPGGTPLTMIGGKVVVGGVFKAGAGYEFSEVHVDSASLAYTRPYVAEAGENYLSFSAPDDGALGYDVTVPDTGWPMVFAHANGNLVLLAPEFQAKHTTPAGEKQRLIRFASLDGASTSSDRVEYWVSGKRGALSVEALSAKSIVSTSSLLTQAAGSDMLIIAHPSFMGTGSNGSDPLSSYAVFKQSQGYRVSIIDYLDVVDAFGGGQPGPGGLTNYLGQVDAQGTLEHVLLVGGSSYDHTDKLGTGSMTFIPGHYGKSSYSNYTVSDTPYITGADRQLFASIGRWPVRSDADLSSIIANSMAWSTSDHSNGSALVIAEHTLAGENIDFAAALDGVAGQLPDNWSTTKVNVDAIMVNDPGLSLKQALNQAKGEIINGLESGPDVVLYNGHGTTSQLSNKGLFKAADVAGINGQSSQLWVSMSCYMTYYETTHMNTLAHQLLFRGRAAGITGAMLLSNQGENIAAGTAVLDSMVNNTINIGEAVTAHKRAQSNPTLNINLSHLGDPTLGM